MEARRRRYAFAEQSSIHFSEHARWRASQRNLSLEDALYVHRHGRRIRRAGAIHVFLRRKDIPPADRRDSRIAQLEGTLLMLDSSGRQVLTIYRNRRRGLKDARVKQKYFQN